MVQVVGTLDDHEHARFGRAHFVEELPPHLHALDASDAVSVEAELDEKQLEQLGAVERARL